MDSKRKEEITAIYDRLYTLLHKKKIDRKVVKRLLYDDKETHKRLGISESTLNTMWDRLCRGSQNPPRIDGFVIIKDTPFEVIKLEKNKKPKQAKKGGGKMAREVIQYDPSTNKEIKRFKSAIECAEAMGLNANYIRRVAEGDVKNPSINVRYGSSSEQKVEISEQKPKRTYNKKVTISTVVPNDQELEVAKVIEKVTKPFGFAGEGKAELKNVIAEVLKSSTVDAEIADELTGGYEELRETELEKQDEPNSFETAPNPEPVPQAMVESHLWVKTPVGLKFEPVEQKIVINADVEIQHTPGDKTTLEVIRTAYIQELKNHINDEVKKLTSEIIAEETKLFIEGTKTI